MGASLSLWRALWQLFSFVSCSPEEAWSQSSSPPETLGGCLRGWLQHWRWRAFLGVSAGESSRRQDPQPSGCLNSSPCALRRRCAKPPPKRSLARCRSLLDMEPRTATLLEGVLNEGKPKKAPGFEFEGPSTGSQAFRCTGLRLSAAQGGCRPTAGVAQRRRSSSMACQKRDGACAPAHFGVGVFGNRAPKIDTILVNGNGTPQSDPVVSKPPTRGEVVTFSARSDPGPIVLYPLPETTLKTLPSSPRACNRYMSHDRFPSRS